MEDLSFVQKHKQNIDLYRSALTLSLTSRSKIFLSVKFMHFSFDSSISGYFLGRKSVASKDSATPYTNAK